MDTILPYPAHLELLRLTATVQAITAVMCPLQSGNACPLCHHMATRVHSPYVRHLLDLPWHPVSLRLELHVRRFFCDTPDCPRQIFTERLPTVVAPYARRTPALDTWFSLVGLAVGGEAGARLLRELGITTSPDTLLTQVRSLSIPAFPAPRVVGIDEFAFRRGRIFGTVILDLETQRPIEVLPACELATVKRWLLQQPQIEVVSRDRAYNFGEAVHQGAPQALQVADRFHVLQNLSERLEGFWREHKDVLRSARQTTFLVAPARVPHGNTRTQEAYERRAELHQQIHALKRRGVSIMSIARTLDVSRPTVHKYLGMAQPPAPRGHPDGTPHSLAPHVAYLLQRWNDGCRNATLLWRELQEHGHRLSPRTVSRYLTLLRREAGVPWKFQTVAPSTTYAPHDPLPAALTIRHAVQLMHRRPAEVSQREQSHLARLRASDPLIERTYQQVQQFCQMVRTRGGAALTPWMDEVQQTGCAELKAFVASLRKDEAAVRMGLTVKWSQGPVEGHVHRIKFIKRSGYGRVNFDLLRQRILLRQAS